jgi:hypothetical protein
MAPDDDSSEPAQHIDCDKSEDTSRLVLVDSVRVDKATKHVAVTVSGLAERTLHRFTYPPEHPYRHLKPGWKLKMVHSGRGNPTLELVTSEEKSNEADH